MSIDIVIRMVNKP